MGILVNEKKKKKKTEKRKLVSSLTATIGMIYLVADDYWDDDDDDDDDFFADQWSQLQAALQEQNLYSSEKVWFFHTIFFSFTKTPFGCLVAYLFIYLFTYLFGCLLACLLCFSFFLLFVYLFIYLFIYLFTCFFVRLFVCFLLIPKPQFLTLFHQYKWFPINNIFYLAFRCGNLLPYRFSNRKTT